MCLRLFVFVVGYHIVTGEVNLMVPVAGNCGDDTVLTCRYTADSCSAWSFTRSDVAVCNHVVPVTDKYEGYVNSGQQTITLTIKNTELADAGRYNCACGFDVSTDKDLLFECKTTAVTKRIRQDKRLEINFNQVYPNPASVFVTVNSNPQPGTHTCTGSTSTSYSCTWTSSSSLKDVDGGYRVVVTTVTQTILNGNIKIVTPGRPNISNLEQLSDGLRVIRVTEDRQVTLTCVSSGGIPAPTVAWYRASISTSPLKSTSTGVEQGDGTYRVTLTYTITARRSDDLGTFVCRSFYQQATSTVTQGSQETSALLYLNSALEDNRTCINQGDLIGGVVGSLLVGILIGLGIFFLFGRYRTCNSRYLKSGSHDNLSVKLQKRERVEISPRENTNQEPGELIAGDQAIGLSPVTYEELSKLPGEDKQHYESLKTSENPDKVYYNIQD